MQIYPWLGGIQHYHFIEEENHLLIVLVLAQFLTILGILIKSDRSCECWKVSESMRESWWAGKTEKVWTSLKSDVSKKLPVSAKSRSTCATEICLSHPRTIWNQFTLLKLNRVFIFSFLSYWNAKPHKDTLIFILSIQLLY